jgi:moderate conductance mechanosensitive channel
MHSLNQLATRLTAFGVPGPFARAVVVILFLLLAAFVANWMVNYFFSSLADNSSAIDAVSESKRKRIKRLLKVGCALAIAAGAFFNPEEMSHSAMRIGGILFVAVVCLLAADFFIGRFDQFLNKGLKNEETIKRANTLNRVLKSLSFAAVILVSALLVLSELKIDIKPIIAAAGIGGVALGFGAQGLVKDLISGFFLILENQIRVGDVVQIGSTSGVVEDIRLRVLLLRDLSGNLHIIPHGNINEVTNMTHSFSYFVFDYSIAYKENVEKVLEAIGEVAGELAADPEFKSDVLEPAEIMGLERFESSGVIVKGRIKTKPMSQWRVGRELNLRIKNRFEKLGIEIPGAQRTVYLANLPESLLKSSSNDKEV